ncbi:Ribonuclease HI [Alkalibacterium sp. AK22]|uniref:ribonuclease HI family protein n=1 Tax=Alkalibacterium sp. AK22 TaxID=1229520 RepID=UPI00044949DD|nr:ribonuclease HI family protein [Alkalibacterium sp. AK22]EXJ22611.1 Ribonuclease HI [Alkalibacterium sp. AK22]
MLKIYSDAAVSQQQKCAGAGLVVSGEHLHEQLSFPLPGILDNHLAELHAFHLALRWVIDNERTTEWAVFHTDSQLVAQSVEKGHIKKEAYTSIFELILSSLSMLQLYEITWIPEKDNKGADNLAKQAIANQLKKRRKK